MGSDEPVVGSSEVRRLEERIRELERLLGRKTMEVEILKEALAGRRQKNRAGARCRCRWTVPGEGGRRHPGRGALEPGGAGGSGAAVAAPYRKAGDAELLARIRALVDQRPTYGYRRITALVNRSAR